ncbi:response regulator [Oscillatoria sp. FACHB-1407]|uniref:hybrid sensor histidine kinase/response regulator n=1 Tax=Oscillatoria sp. FACHB-1407 TaxID=2692847 RepID=UPI001689F6E9|nr:ATP-binding protein [Oscillatoria sp. FACHB-1407]MBD2461242.1 response regulator [Oscillatoria sp. FACHB-1407]
MPSDVNVNILLVDDHPENLVALEAILNGLGNLVMAHSGSEALKYLLNQEFAVILLDVQMPGIDGFETASLIRQRQRSSHTPIIFLTAFSTSDIMMFKGYSLGAVDYLLKPIDPVVLTSKVSVFVDLYKKNAEIQWQADRMAAMNLELQQSEERFRRLSACSPVGIFLADLERGCFYTNPRCQSICGFTFEESLGDGWIDFIYPDDRDRAVRKWFNYIRANAHTEFLDEYRYQNKDGTIRWTTMRASPMFSDNGALMGHVGTIEDITERKQAEATRAQMIQEQAARQEAERANRMKDEFLAVLSHELRTPLNAILGWSKLLLTRDLDPGMMERALDTIERNAKSQAKLVEDILDVSLIVQGKLRLNPCQISLVTLVESTLETFQPIALEKQIQLELILPEGITSELAHTNPDAVSAMRVYGDPERLRQVIRNLLTNAIKFTPEEGLVEVKLSVVERDGQPSMVNGQPSMVNGQPSMVNGQSSVAQIQVRDTGIGIAPDFLPYVFDRFRQADSTTTRSYSGLGLGLAIVDHIVKLHNGDIRVESEGTGKGATFTVTLPLAQSSATPCEGFDKQMENQQVEQQLIMENQLHSVKSQHLEVVNQDACVEEQTELSSWA